MSFRADRHGIAKGTMAALFGSQVVRFGVVLVIGMVVDVATGWFLSAGAGMPLVPAIGASFVVNFLLNKLLVFRGAAMHRADGPSPAEASY